MAVTEIFKILIMIVMIVCAIATNLTKKLLTTVTIFMSYSSLMCILWVLLESPDLAITEAAVGAGVSTILFLVTLKKLGQLDERDEEEEAGHE